MPCSYLVNSLPPASRPSFSFYRVVSPAPNYDYAVTLFTPASPSLRGLALGGAGAGAAGAPPSPDQAALPSPAQAASPRSSLVVWVVVAACGSCLTAAGVAVVRRARVARAAHANKKFDKIPATLVAMLGEAAAAGAAAAHDIIASPAPLSSPPTGPPRGRKILHFLDSRIKLPAAGGAAPPAARAGGSRRDGVMLRALAPVDVVARQERRDGLVHEAGARVASAGVAPATPRFRFAAGLLGSDDDEESPRVRAAPASWQEADSDHAAPASVTVLPK